MTVCASSALPKALLSRSALRDGIRTHLRTGVACDLRADAWGHGLRAVAEAVAAEGVRAVVVDTDEDAAQLADVPVTAQVGGPVAEGSGALYGVGTDRAVMELMGRVLSTKPLRAGGGVSYGYTYRAERDTTVALVTGGYAQGIVRALGNRASVLIAGELCPIVGRVAMDVCVVDVADRAVTAGAPVTFFGGAHHTALSEWSDATGMTPGELVSVVGQHAVREWVA